MVRRKPRLLVLGERLLRRRPRARLVGLGAAAGAAVLVLAFSLVRAYWEAPTDRSTAISVPWAASSPGAGPDEPPAASAEAPAISRAPEPGPAIEDRGGPQGASPRAASRAKADPAPPDAWALLLAARQALDASTRDRQSGQSPPASAPRSRSPEDVAPSGVQISAEDSGEPPASSPQTAARPETPGSRATPNPPGDAFSSVARPAATAGKGPGLHPLRRGAGGRCGPGAAARQLPGASGLHRGRNPPGRFQHRQAQRALLLEADRSTSERLVDELESFLDDAAARSPDHASDFTDFTPKPRPGNVEVWLAGAREGGPDRAAGVRSLSKNRVAAPLPER